MTRRRVDKSAKLIRKVTVAMSETFYNRMAGWLAASNCRSLAELARRILYREEIVWKHKDESVEAVVIELDSIRKELNAIGRNINQITHHFHKADTDKQKLFAALDVKKSYDKVGEKVNKLLGIAEGLSKKWLQG